MKPLSQLTAAGGVPTLLEALGLDDDSPRMEWLGQALCAETDPEVFFPKQGGSNVAARSTCMSCEARISCLEWAIEAGEMHGIWGGMIETERRAYAKRNGLDYGALAGDLRDLMPPAGREHSEDETVTHEFDEFAA